MSTPPLLSRYAEAAFWLGRYVERTESLARILDVMQTFAREADGSLNWRSAVQIFSSEADFDARYDEASDQTISQYYFRDRDNPDSAPACIAMARENARSLRPLISTEMWAHLNRFYGDMRALRSTDFQGTRFSGLCGAIRTDCQTFEGTVEGTMYRGQAWMFLQLGKYLERADQTTRLLDIRYQATVDGGRADPGMEQSRWQSLLRAAAGYHAFLRASDLPPGPVTVADFLLRNESFPRSVLLCVAQVEGFLSTARRRFKLGKADGAIDRLAELHATLASQPVERIIDHGLHDFLEGIQDALIAISNDIADSYFRRG